MKTTVDTCLKDIAGFFIKNRRSMTEVELESILKKHCESEAEVKKFISFLETEPGQLRFKTLLRERKEHTSYPKEVGIPELVQRGIFELKTYGRVSEYYRASKEERKAIDDWLVRIKHPLAYEPGDMEYRYLAIVKELSAKEPV